MLRNSAPAQFYVDDEPVTNFSVAEAILFVVFISSPV